MNRVLEVTIPGDPVGASRPRVVMKRDKSGVMSYMPKEHVAWERKAVACIRAAHCRTSVGLLDGAVGLTVLAIHPRPATRRRKSDPRARIPCLVKPDFDNVIKLAADALSKAGVWKDDNRVVRCLFEGWEQAIGEHVVGGTAPDAEPTRVVLGVFDLGVQGG